MKTTKATKQQMNVIKTIMIDATFSSELLFEDLNEERVIEMVEFSIENKDSKGAKYEVDETTHFYLLNSDIALYGFFFEDGKYEAWHSPHRN